MAQAISKQQTTTSSAAPPVDVWMSKELSLRRSGMVGGRLLEALPSIVRSKMEHRQIVVLASTRSASRSELEEAVAGLMMGYPSMRGLSQIEAQVLVRKYADDLAGIPMWAIKAATRDISRGAVSDMSPDFPPSASRVRQLADEHLGWCAKELRDLKAVLTAEVEPPANPDMAARISAGFQKLKSELRASNDPRPKDALKPQAMTAEQLKHHYQHHGLAFAPKAQEAAE